MRCSLLLLLCLAALLPCQASNTPRAINPSETVYLLKPAHVFDGESANFTTTGLCSFVARRSRR